MSSQSVTSPLWFRLNVGPNPFPSGSCRRVSVSSNFRFVPSLFRLPFPHRFGTDRTNFFIDFSSINVINNSILPIDGYLKGANLKKIFYEFFKYSNRYGKLKEKRFNTSHILKFKLISIEIARTSRIIKDTYIISLFFLNSKKWIAWYRWSLIITHLSRQSQGFGAIRTYIPGIFRRFMKILCAYRACTVAAFVVVVVVVTIRHQVCTGRRRSLGWVNFEYRDARDSFYISSSIIGDEFPGSPCHESGTSCTHMPFHDVRGGIYVSVYDVYVCVHGWCISDAFPSLSKPSGVIRVRFRTCSRRVRLVNKGGTR